jgi:hypothetical protein
VTAKWTDLGDGLWLLKRGRLRFYVSELVRGLGFRWGGFRGKRSLDRAFGCEPTFESAKALAESRASEESS